MKFNEKGRENDSYLYLFYKNYPKHQHLLNNNTDLFNI